MRQKIREGLGGPFMIPGVGNVIDGEEFDYPELVPGAVSLEPPEGEAGAGDDGTAGTGTGEDQGGSGEPADPPAEPQSKTRAKGARS